MKTYSARSLWDGFNRWRQRKSRKRWITFAALWLAFDLADARPAPPPVRPNIILIAVDDLDVRSLDTLVHAGFMPNLKARLIDHGVTFRQSFCTTPVCTPSRATLLTGRYAHNHGVARNESPFGGVTSFNDSSTLATWLRAGGYRTGYAGKYLSGYGTSDVNRDGLLDVSDLTYIPPGWNYWWGLLEPYVSRMYQYGANDNGTLISYGTTATEYQTDVLAGRAAAFLDAFERDSDADPFFLTVAPGAPHLEVLPGFPHSSYSDAWKWSIRPAPRHLDSVLLPLPQPPSFNEADMSDKPAWLRLRPLLTSEDIANLTSQYRNRLASVRAIDDMIGGLFSKLASLNELDRTIVFFTSDNGYLYGVHRLPQKLVAHEESIRVPLIVSAPWLAKAEAGQFVINNDLAPTIAELAGISPIQAMDGTSFVPLLVNPARAGWRQRFLIERWPGQPSFLELPSYFAIRTASGSIDTSNQVLMQYSAGGREFYDLNESQWQTNSLHADPSPIRVLQRYVLSSWMNLLVTCSGAECRDSEFYR